jgi:hypothetical protein
VEKPEYLHFFCSNYRTDSSGRFCFEEFEFTGNARVIVSAVGEKGKLQGHLILDSMWYIPEKVQMNEYRRKQIAVKYLTKDDNLSKLEQEYEIKKSIRRKYTLSDTIMLGEVEVISKQKKQPPVNYAIHKDSCRNT